MPMLCIFFFQKNLTILKEVIIFKKKIKKQFLHLTNGIIFWKSKSKRLCQPIQQNLSSSIKLNTKQNSILYFLQ